MAPNKQTTSSLQTWPWWRWVLTGLSALALALSGYLGWHFLMGGTVIGCGGGSPCDQVLSSRWAMIGGLLPVAGLAAGAYLAMLAASLYVGADTEEPVRLMAWRAILILVGAAAGSAVWFILVQKWIIGAFCPYCMATHMTGLVLAALVIWQAIQQVSNDSPTASRRLIGSSSATGFVMIGLALAGTMAACQVGITPPVVYSDGQSQNKLPVIDLHNAPLAGSPDATNVVNLLFDYKCPHCQKIHSMLDEVVQRFNGKVVFTLCPVPLNTQCNPYVARDVDEFKDSCELAKIALAVWAAKRDAFTNFDRWMFSPDSDGVWRARTLDAAKAKAIELVGQAKFDAVQSDPWIDQYLQTSIRIFGDTIQGALPKLVYGARWVIPEPNNADDLVMILHGSLGVPKP